ncbi:AsmA family protein [Lichenifustis flavocetrariae]|uniref:AsmA family protein n=1 Tax=Lichenifustis flavocetrariae TaxID=2949735 RepID=A0AA41YTX5_9HYPH|nr:AsmA family protein [Lichenifustis flavocetrariae]MCW6508511.1 AsmA family protein [Lichenifustis flavocetrariae]
MRESLTIFAIALILVLSALLVGPYLVDWNKQRDWLAAKLSQTTGAQVTIAGPIDVKLLPRPLFRAGKVSIQGATRHDPWVSAAGLDAELSINSLLQGSVEFVDATLVAPRIELTARADGSLVASSWDVANPQKFMFRHVTLRDGSVLIRDEDGGERASLTGINAQGEAETLFGPIRLAGQAKNSQGTFRFRLNTGAYSGRRLRLKLIADDLKPLSHVDIDGIATVDPGPGPKAGTAALAFQGNVAISGSLHVADGAAPVPWQATAGDFKADGRGLSSTALELRAGADARALVANGALLVDLGAAPSAALKLRARQLDLDHLAVAPAVAPDTRRPKPEQWIAALQTMFASSGSPLPMRLSLDTGIDAVTSGDLTLTDATTTLDLIPGLPTRGRFSISGPDGLHLALDGTMETGAAAVFKGQIDAATRDLSASADWLAPLAPEAADWIGRNVPIHTVALSGPVDLSKTGFAAHDMTVTVDGSTVTGAVAMTRGVGDERARLFADVRADALDTEHFPALDELSTLTAPLDLSLGVAAQSVKLSHTGLGALQTGPIALHLTKVGTAVTLDTFSVTGLDGASVTATGSLDAEKRIKTRGQIRAANTSPLAALLHQIMPNGATDTLLARSGLLSPLGLDFSCEGAIGSDGRFVPTLATAKGTAAATRISATITPEPARLFAASALNTLVVLDAPDMGPLLRQAGLDDTAPGLLGPGHVELTARGTLDSGFDTHLSTSATDASLVFDGALDGVTGTGHLKASGRNAALLLKALAMTSPPASALWPWNAEADLAWTGDKATVSKLAGHFNGTEFSGSLESAPDAGGLTGSLTLDSVPLAGLTGLLLAPGSNAPPDPGRWLTSARFAPAVETLPKARVALQIHNLGLSEGLALRNAALELRLTPSSLGFADLSGDMLGGKASGTLTLRRDGPIASLSGQLQVANLVLALPSLSGKLSGSFSVAGSGTSLDGLVSSLAGDGALNVAATLPHFDPQALTSTAHAYDAEGATIDNDAIRDALAKALDRNSLDLGTVTAPATIAAGTLRAVGLQSQGPLATTSSEVAFDLRSLQFTLRTTLTTVDLPKDWKGDPPQVTVTWRGPLTTPTREVDAGAFVNGLAARAIARDQERIQLMQDDLRERAFFARRLKAIEEEQRAARDAAQAEKAARTVLPPTRPAPAPSQDPLAKLLSQQPVAPVPPTRPLVRPTRPVELQTSPQALVPPGSGPNTPDPTAEGRY